MNRLSRFLTGMCALTTLLTLAACGGAPAPQATVAPTKAAAAAPTAAPAAQKPIEIEFWTLLAGGQGAMLDKQIKDFNAKQDKIKVTNVNLGGYAQIQQKLLASISAGNMPPITMVDYIFVPFYAKQGVFEPLNSYLTDKDVADFFPGLLVDLKFRDKIYALPYSRSTQGFFYNADLLNEMGIKQPAQTWDEFAEQAKLIKKTKPEYSAGYAYFDRWTYEALILAWGGRMNDENCNPTYAEPAQVAVLQFFQNLYKDKLLILPNTLEGSIQQQNTDFVQGRVAYMPRSTSWLTQMGDNVKFKWGFTFMPAGAKGRAITNGGGNIAINAKASPEQKAAAWELLKFLTDTDRTAEFHTGTGYMATRASALELPAIKKLHEEKPFYRLSIDQLQYAQPTACVARNVTEYNTLVGDAIQRVLIKGEDAKAVLTELNKDLQNKVDKMRADKTLVE